MKKIIWGIVALIVVVLGIWYFTSGSAGVSVLGGNEQATTTAQGTSTSTATGSASGSTSSGGTLRSLASQSGNFTCTISVAQSSGQTTGTMYGAGGKIRLDFSAPSQSGSVRTHIIRSGGFSYIWVDGQTVGIKTAVANESSVTPASGGSVSDDSKVSSECHPWVPDASQFTPPSGISFMAQ